MSYNTTNLNKFQERCRLSSKKITITKQLRTLLFNSKQKNIIETKEDLVYLFCACYLTTQICENIPSKFQPTWVLLDDNKILKKQSKLFIAAIYALFSKNYNAHDFLISFKNLQFNPSCVLIPKQIRMVIDEYHNIVKPLENAYCYGISNALIEGVNLFALNDEFENIECDVFDIIYNFVNLYLLPNINDPFIILESDLGTMPNKFQNDFWDCELVDDSLEFEKNEECNSFVFKPNPIKINFDVQIACHSLNRLEKARTV